MEKELKIGDIVKSKSGGPEMVFAGTQINLSKVILDGNKPKNPVIYLCRDIDSRELLPDDFLLEELEFIR